MKKIITNFQNDSSDDEIIYGTSNVKIGLGAIINSRKFHRPNTISPIRTCEKRWPDKNLERIKRFYGSPGHLSDDESIGPSSKYLSRNSKPKNYPNYLTQTSDRSPLPEVVDKLGNNDYFCEVCDLHMSGPEPFNAHIEGKKHIKKLKILPECEFVPEVSVPCPSFSLVENNSGCRKYIEEKLQTVSQPLIGVQFILEYFYRSDKRDDPKYVCELCDRKCNSNSLVSHLEGYLHRWSYVKLKYPIYADQIRGYGPKKSDRRKVLEKCARKIEEEEGGKRKIKASIVSSDHAIKENYLSEKFTYPSFDGEADICEYKDFLAFKRYKRARLAENNLESQNQENNISISTDTFGRRQLPERVTIDSNCLFDSGSINVAVYPTPPKTSEIDNQVGLYPAISPFYKPSLHQHSHTPILNGQQRLFLNAYCMIDSSHVPSRYSDSTGQFLRVMRQRSNLPSWEFSNQFTVVIKLINSNSTINPSQIGVTALCDSFPTTEKVIRDRINAEVHREVDRFIKKLKKEAKKK